MYTIDGRFASALLTIDNLDGDAVSQLYGLLNARSAEGSHVAIMPDGHAGGSCLVGFTQRFDDEAETRIVPNFVGGDIACGIFAWPIGRKVPDLNALDRFLRGKYPVGTDPCQMRVTSVERDIPCQISAWGENRTMSISIFSWQ